MFCWCYRLGCIVQGFNWESCKSDWYKVLMGQMDQIAAAGFTAVWFPPPSDSVSPQGYLPRDLYHLDSAYGSEAQLRECIQMFNSKDIKVCADIVVNHRCAHKQVRCIMHPLHAFSVPMENCCVLNVT